MELGLFLPWQWLLALVNFLTVCRFAERLLPSLSWQYIRVGHSIAGIDYLTTFNSAKYFYSYNIYLGKGSFSFTFFRERFVRLFWLNLTFCCLLLSKWIDLSRRSKSAWNWSRSGVSHNSLSPATLIFRGSPIFCVKGNYTFHTIFLALKGEW